jgi:hypothetical protein
LPGPFFWRTAPKIRHIRKLQETFFRKDKNFVALQIWPCFPCGIWSQGKACLHADPSDMNKGGNDTTKPSGLCRQSWQKPNQIKSKRDRTMRWLGVEAALRKSPDTTGVRER